ncbi:hypothetical protein [Anabaena sp. PCC 7108]|uniref:hypothetical protein n=1 Tax=Anabaena sp. PCC 7108 TaxID=163908 RepID=UPI00034D9993|nr:hypothetical protein [Anabaena sp. PCC 7108]
MLKTFNAILKNNSIQWVDETPEIELDSSIKVHITLLEETATPKTKSNGQKMAEVLRKISTKKIFEEIDPQKWQQEIRQDRSLPNRD